MPKLGIFSGKDVRRILEGKGFVCVRQRGSHTVMQKVQDRSTITVPIPMHRELRIGTLQSIIRQSGLPRSLFEK